MGSLTEQFDDLGMNAYMMSSAEIEVLACSQCSGPMRLTRVFPSILADASVQAGVFECTGCRASLTRTSRPG
jgi:hypothetical protein